MWLNCIVHQAIRGSKNGRYIFRTIYISTHLKVTRPEGTWHNGWSYQITWKLYAMRHLSVRTSEPALFVKVDYLVVLSDWERTFRIFYMCPCIVNDMHTSTLVTHIYYGLDIDISFHFFPLHLVKLIFVPMQCVLRSSSWMKNTLTARSW